MATNKNALIRYKVLDKCFRNPGKQYFIEDLIDECNLVLSDIDPNTNGISLRQIREDIAFMKSKEGWEIELGHYKVGKKFYYRYSDTSFSINNMPLNEMEVNQLKSAIDILAQFKGMPQFVWVNELVPKLNMGLQTNTTTVIEFDNNEYLKGIDNLGILYNAILYKKVLEISYKPYKNSQPDKIIFHPYYLKQYNNRWFIFGYHSVFAKSDWNLALDRILSIVELDVDYQDNDSIDWQEYFEDMIGVTKQLGANIEKIVLHFNTTTGNYIETKPLHGSQKSKWLNSNTLEVTLNLIVNYELERLVLSYADSVVVKEPVMLADLVQKRLKCAIGNYLL